MNQCRYLSIAILLAASVAVGGEPKRFADIENDEPTTGIRIVTPPGELQKGKLYQFPITGLPEEDFAKATAEATPSEGVTRELSMTLDRKPFMWFLVEDKGDGIGGTFNLRVITNGKHQTWRQEFERGLAYAKNAKIDEELLAEFTALAEKAERTYPVRSGLAVISVAGARPPPPPPIIPIPPPPQPAAGIVYAIIIRTTDTLTADAAKILSDLRQWTDQEPRVTHLEFPPDAVGPGGERDPNVATWVARIPPTAKQPFLFIAQKGTNGRMVVHHESELPATAAEIIAKMKEHIR